MSEQNAELAGKHYWPADHYSIPADNLCWHSPSKGQPDPRRCIKATGHDGRHQYEKHPVIKAHSHKAGAK
ncbi:hypothetical protein [Ferrovibrio terrae]|uniref:hypothetical protein n=1 Tax=Ferrovibrio terrae TaxID=2594003 RepID=UPI0031376ED8